MKITDIKTQVHNENRVSVYIDDLYAFSLSDTDALMHNVTIGKELSESDFEFLKSIGDESKALKAAMDLISKKGVTKKTLFDYLKKKGYEKEVCENVASDLKNLGYIDDYSFALSYICDAYEYKKHGKSRIENDLKKKGVSSETIREAFEECNLDFSQNLMELMRERFKNIDFSDFKEKQKIIRYFAYRGYSISEITSAVSSLSSE